MSSSKINIEEMPKVPYIGYYDTDIKDSVDSNGIDNTPSNSNSLLTKNLKKSCISANGDWSKTNGIYDLSEATAYLPTTVKGIPSLDVPFYLAKAGVLVSGSSGSSTTSSSSNSSSNSSSTTSSSSNSSSNSSSSSLTESFASKNSLPSLSDKISQKCNSGDAGKAQISNQIQYLTCQLEQERNRSYSSKDLEINNSTDSVRTIFEKSSNIKSLLIVLFGLSIYLFLNGFFGSLDFSMNLFALIEKNSESSIQYWIGILLGLFIPFGLLIGNYSAVICHNLSDLENNEITNDPYGVKNNISNKDKTFDIITLILFLFLLYCLVAVLFTVKRSSLGSTIYSIIVCIILSIIGVLIYILYAFVPFFNSADSDNIGNDKNDIRLFIDDNNEPSNIETNQSQDGNVRRIFIQTFIVIIVCTIIYFKINSGKENKKTSSIISSILSGLFGSCAILAIPIIWVLNLFLAINFFYIYPIIIMLFRFIRYLVMSALYILSSKSDSLKDSFSEDLVAQLDNFKNYSPSWGLIGMNELKTLLNTMGYNNLFSKDIFPDEEYGTNISANKFFASGLLGSFVQAAAGNESNVKGMIFAVINFVLTMIICSIILYGIVRIQKI